MSVSDLFSTLIKARRVVAIVSILAGAAYKVAPMVWHKADAAHAPARTTIHAFAATATTNSNFNFNSNPVAAKTTDCDLGEISLTNHYETCVLLGAGKDCVLTPKMIDSHTVQLTVKVESKTAAGKTRDLSVTQVITPSGKPFEVAVGGLSLSLTPNVSLE
jgi:hypothetical protein